MAAEKVVPGDPGQAMKWLVPAPTQRQWRGPVEIEGRRVGEVFLFANPQFPRAWNYKLGYRGEEVYRIDAKPSAARHSNRGCPDQFPGKVRAREHEHVWLEGLGCYCARPLANLEASDHRAILGEFCARANIRFHPGYASPLVGAQMQLL